MGLCRRDRSLALDQARVAAAQAAAAHKALIGARYGSARRVRPTVLSDHIPPGPTLGTVVFDNQTQRR